MTDLEAAANKMYAAQDRVNESERGSDQWVEARMHLSAARDHYDQVVRDRALSVPIRKA
jgi:hypothetical protein